MARSLRGVLTNREKRRDDRILFVYVIIKRFSKSTVSPGRKYNRNFLSEEDGDEDEKENESFI